MYRLCIQCAVRIVLRCHVARCAQLQHLLRQLSYFITDFCKFPDKSFPCQPRARGRSRGKYRVHVFFEPLNLRSIHICLHIVPKAPAKTHVGVVIFETEEILPTDPSTFIPVFPIDGITEDLGIFRNIVCNETSEFTRQYGSVSYRTSSGEQIHERMRRGKIRNNPFRNTILRTLIR